MDVRSVEDIAPVAEHNGTTNVWWLVPPREMYEQSAGGHLELIAEWEVQGGGEVFPHSHPTHEYYYIISGRGFINIEGDERAVQAGDLVYIPPDKVHSARPATTNASLRAVSFAVGVPGADPIDYTNHDAPGA